MRRLLLIFCVFLIAGVALALVFRDQQGYVLIAFNGWQIETSLLFAVCVLVVAVWLLLTLARLLSAGLSLPRSVRRRWSQRRTRKARRSLYDGLVKLAEGRWSAAEQQLRHLAERNDAPGLNYLYAARAAQNQRHIADRDQYLDRAAAQKGVSELAVLLTRAQLQCEQGQSSEALASLSRLYQIEPDHPEVLRLYAGQALNVGDYGQLRALLPGLYKHANLPAERIDALAVEAWSADLREHASDTQSLTTAWQRVPKHLRGHSDMVRHYVECLHHAGADDEAADVIRGALAREWNASLILLFGDLESEDSSAQLATIESWLKQYGQEPELMLVAGRLCLRNRLWGRARSYFEASQSNQSRPDALLELGRLYEQINERDEARSAYRRGLELRTGPNAQPVRA